MKSTKNIILLSVTLMAFAIFFIQIAYSIYEQQTDTIELKESMIAGRVVEEAKLLDNRISLASQNARVLALLIENDASYNIGTYEQLIKDTLIEQDMIFGMGYWFEPFRYKSSLKYFGPYLYKDDNGSVVRTMSYSNEDYDYFSWSWYSDSITSDQLMVYSSPFYDEMLDTVFMTGSVKVFKEEEQVGVVSIDITLREVNAILNDLKERTGADAYIVTSDGYYWGSTHGQSSKLDENILTTEDQELQDVGQSMFSGDGDRKSYQSADKLYVWSPIGQTGLTLMTAYSKKALLDSVYKTVTSSSTYFILAMMIFIFLLNSILVKRIENPLKAIVSENADLETSKVRYADGGQAAPDIDQLIHLIQGLLEERETYIVSLNESNDELQDKNEEVEALYNQSAAMNSKLQSLLEEVEQGYIVTVRSLSNAIEAKDKYTKGHCESVTEYSMMTARELGLSQEDLRVLEYSALLHDVGKIGIPSDILNKPGKLTDEEFDIIKSHPAIGYEILKDIEFLDRSAEIIYQHHERFDGDGYPRGVGGEDLDILTRIITVTDAYDAMTSARPYRLNPLSHEKAVSILQEGSGTQFDTRVVEAFLRVLNKK